MLKLKKLLSIRNAIAIFCVAILMAIFTNPNDGQGSVPIRTGTETFTVDVCINQDCDYIADGQNDEREIKQAVDAVLAAGGGRVNIRNGDYSISEPINISLSGESLIIKGDGIDTRLTSNMTATGTLGSMFNITGQASTLLSTTTGVSAATSTAGSLDPDTYYFVLQTLDNTGAFSQTSSEVNCPIGVGALEGYATSSQCVLTWTDPTGDEETKIWVSTTSGSYSQFFMATTTGSYYLATSTNGLILPTAISVATSTVGSLSTSTYHIRLTTLDAEDNETLATDEITCQVGFEEATPLSKQCIITYTDADNASTTRVWVSRSSENYVEYFNASTTGSYYLATTTGATSGTFPTANNTSLLTDPISGTLETIFLDSFTFKDIYLAGNSTGGRGLIMENINEIEILSSKFTDFTSDGTSGTPIFASSSGQTIIQNSVFKDNTEDIELSGRTKNTYIYNNRFNDSGEITIGSNATNITIKDNSDLSTITDNGGVNVTRMTPSFINIGTFTQGGGLRASSTDDVTALLLASDFDAENYIDFTPNLIDITLTLPASSTMSDIIPNVGDYRTFFIRNATTTPDAIVILAAGTGWDVEMGTSTPTIYVDDHLIIEMVRKNNTDIFAKIR